MWSFAVLGVAEKVQVNMFTAILRENSPDVIKIVVLFTRCVTPPLSNLTMFKLFAWQSLQSCKCNGQIIEVNIVATNFSLLGG